MALLLAFLVRVTGLEPVFGIFVFWLCNTGL